MVSKIYIYIYIIYISVESKVEVMLEACRNGVVGAGVSAHCLCFFCADSAYFTGILRS